MNDVTNGRELTHIGVVQVGGLVEDGAVVTQPFPDRASAIDWVSEQVTEAHGDQAVISTSKVKYPYLSSSYDIDFDEAEVLMIRSIGGPVWGFVIETT